MSPKNITRSVIPAIDLYCRKANFKTLKSLSMILGSKKEWYDTKKAPLRTFLVSRCGIFEQLRGRLVEDGKVNLFSVFLTNDSFSFCKMTVDDKFNTSLVDWQKYPLTVHLPLTEDRISVYYLLIHCLQLKRSYRFLVYLLI